MSGWNAGREGAQRDDSRSSRLTREEDLPRENSSVNLDYGRSRETEGGWEGGQLREEKTREELCARVGDDDEIDNNNRTLL